jgi:cytoplasmic iron level regulating protein YaaA (DUF328/UPF0246 family)
MADPSPAYAPRSSVLIISICSRTKNTTPGVSHYDQDDSILSRISPEKQDHLRTMRGNILDTLKDVSWQSRKVSELRMNRKLAKGPDFGGEEEGKYLPAIDRYEGNFYREGGMGPARKETVCTSGHHHLILSGLYGLVAPTEPIQLYSCPVEMESIGVQNTWTEANALTGILIDYVRKNGITHIFDLSARKIYRDLIDWNLVRERTGSSVLHCFADDAAGDAALPIFGRFAGEFLFPSSEETLKKINTEDLLDFEYGTFVFRKIPLPPEGFAKEPVIGMPDEDPSEEGRKRRQGYLTARVDEFERTIRRFLAHTLNERRPDYWDSFDQHYKTRAEKEMKDHLQKYPMIAEDDVSPIDFLYLPDYSRLIKQNWDIFEPIFRDSEQVKKHIGNIIELRNPMYHANPIPRSTEKIGEGSILWFDAIMKRHMEKGLK